MLCRHLLHKLNRKSLKIALLFLRFFSIVSAKPTRHITHQNTDYLSGALYHDEKPWPESHSFKNLIEGDETSDLIYIPDFKYEIFDLQRSIGQLDVFTPELKSFLKIFSLSCRQNHVNLLGFLTDIIDGWLHLPKTKIFENMIIMESYLSRVCRRQPEEFKKSMEKLKKKFDYSTLVIAPGSFGEQIRNEGIEEGLKRGIEKGIEKGIEEGRYQNSLKVAKNLLSRMSDDEISAITGLDLQTVANLRNPNS